jgi:putative addiction module component (TIGR02574 family)
MPFDIAQLLALTAQEKLRIIELLWDDLGSIDEQLPLPVWIETEAARRRDEMRMNPAASLSHDEVWRRVSETRGDTNR